MRFFLLVFCYIKTNSYIYVTDITQIMEIGSTKKESSECTGNTGYGYKMSRLGKSLCICSPILQICVYEYGYKELTH